MLKRVVVRRGQPEHGLDRVVVLLMKEGVKPVFGSLRADQHLPVRPALSSVMQAIDTIAGAASKPIPAVLKSLPNPAESAAESAKEGDDKATNMVKLMCSDLSCLVSPGASEAEVHECSISV